MLADSLIGQQLQTHGPLESHRGWEIGRLQTQSEEEQTQSGKEPHARRITWGKAAQRRAISWTGSPPAIRPPSVTLALWMKRKNRWRVWKRLY